MSENPYQSPAAAGQPVIPTDATRPRTGSWLMLAGIVGLLLAGICTVLTVGGMMAGFRDAAGADNPAELAEGFSQALVWSVAISPLVILGGGLLLAGIVIRRSARTAS